MYWILQLLLRICSLPITPAIHQLLTEVFRSDLDESQELITIVLDINYLRPLPGFKSIGFLMVRLLRKYLTHDAQKQQHRGLEISDWSTAVRPHAVDVWTAC